MAFQFPFITLQELLTAAAKDSQNLPALHYRHITWTYKDLFNRAESVSAGLLGLGYQKNDRIAVMLPNIPEFISVYFGILQMGGIVVAINPSFTVTEVIQLLHIADAGCLIALQSQQPQFKTILDHTDVSTVIVLSEDQTPPPIFEEGTGVDKKIKLFRSVFVEQSDNQKHYPVVSPNDPAIFQFSGGTTGTPKAAIGLHSNVIANVHQFREWLRPARVEGESILAAIPLFHVYGMVLAMSLGLLMRSPIVLIRSASELPAIFEAIRQHRPAIFPCVPSLYAGLLRHPMLKDYIEDFKSLKVCISGSAPLPNSTKDAFEGLIGGCLVEGYGLSEAPTATHCNPVDKTNKVGSIGLPLPGVECRLVDLETQSIDVPAGGQGELLIRGPQIMAGYYNQPCETEIALKDGWLFTGDIAKFDTDGYFYIMGRKKDLIKVGGLQVWPQEIENVLLSYTGVREAAVAGIPNKVLGEVPCAWITAEDGNQLDLSRMMEHCSQHLARYKLPAFIRIVEKIPRSTVGKVLRREIIANEIKNLE